MAKMMGREPRSTAEQESAFDVVCGKGVRVDEAVASRVYKGETYYFCCVGCAETFESDPEAYIREQPVRAYRVEEKRALGPEPEKVRSLEAEAGRYGPEIAEAERRARAARENVARLQRELEQARAKLAEDQRRLQAMRTRAEAAPAEGARIAELEQQVERERMEFDAANRALAEAQRRERDFLMKERGEISGLEGREKALQVEIQALTVRIHDLESRPGGADLQRELEEARARLDKMRREMEQLAIREAQLRVARGVEKGRVAEGAHTVESSRVVAPGVTETQRVETTVEPAGSPAAIGTETSELRQVEEAERALEADIQAQTALVTDLEKRLTVITSMEGELSDARQRLMQRRMELESLGKRSDEIRNELAAEDRQVMDLQRQVERERQEFEAARRALGDARGRAEEIARRRRAEIAELQRSEAGARAGTDAEARRIESIEAQIRRLEDEARAAEARAAELRESERRARDELQRVRREKREVTLEGVSAIPGEVPGELYRAEPESARRHGGSEAGRR